MILKMKKIDMKEIRAYLIIIIVILIIGSIILFANYVESNYELTSYFWIFDIAVIAIMPLYYFIHNSLEKRKTAKQEESMIIKNISFEYYRDIIEEYSPATLSFILDGTEFDKDIGASIIYLINKKYLELQGDKIIRTEKDCSTLSKNLQLLCNRDINHLLAFRKLKIKNVKQQKQANEATETVTEWMELVEKEALEKGLVIERKKYKLTSILSILCILEAIYAICIEVYGLFFFSSILALILCFMKFWTFDENKWVKTQKGYEIYTKIVGLRNYIKDYSMLSDSELKQISIWEDYLIYAIIFNNKTHLNREAMDFYKKVCNM